MRLWIIVGCAFLWLAGLAGWPGANRPNSPLAAAAPVAVEVRQALAAGGQATFLVLLHDQADLSAAYALTDWHARGRHVFDTLTKTADRSQAPLNARRTALPGTVSAWQPLWILNAIVVTGDGDALHALARQPEVAAIVALPAITLPGELEPEVRLPLGISWGVERIGAPEVWAQGLTGAGVTVGVVDTGVEWNHPALIGRYRGWDGTSADHNHNWYNPDPAGTSCTDPAEPCDWMWHGTHVTGSAVGDGGPDHRIGVAPGARWIHALGCCPSESALLLALQWMLAPTDLEGNHPDPDLRPEVVNNSWGGHGGSPLFAPVMEALRAAGIVPVVAAGNSGPECASMLSPGDLANTFSVANVQSDETIRSGSSRGPSPFAGTNPDVGAPGTGIISARLNGSYGSGSGTSMAAPHVAGSVALLIEAAPLLRGQPALIEELLRQSAEPRTALDSCAGVPGEARPNNTFGWGRLNVARAVALVQHAGVVQGQVLDGSGTPLPGAALRLNGPQATLGQSSAPGAGEWRFIAAAGSYTVTAVLPGYAPVSVAEVTISADLTTTLPITLTRLPVSELTGSVRDSASGFFVPAATLHWVADPDHATTAGALGHFTLTLPEGSHLVQISQPGYLDLTLPVTITHPVTDPVTVWLEPAPDYHLASGADFCARPFTWHDPAGGLQLPMGDEAVMQVALPFDFPFYGNSYDKLFVGSNGLVMFSQATGRLNMVVPFIGRPNDAIYAFATDLNPASGEQGMIWATAVGEQFVITWEGVEHWPSGSPETFQAVLSADGVIQLQYHTVSDSSLVVAGVEDSSGTRGRLVEEGLAAGLSVTFVPIAGENSCQAPAAVVLQAQQVRPPWLPLLWLAAPLLLATLLLTRRRTDSEGQPPESS